MYAIRSYYERLVAHRRRGRRVERGEVDHAGVEALPGVGRLPGAVEHRLHAVDVVTRPIVDDRGEVRP